LALAVGAAVWLPLLHLFFTLDLPEFHRAHGLPPRARQLAARHIRLWTDEALRAEETARMRLRNAEWDFMGRSFLVWSLANMALRDPDLRPQVLPVMDRVIEETLRVEQESGFQHFLMPYGRVAPFVVAPARSLFVDGEIALMLGMRRIVQEKPEYAPLLAARVDLMVERMKRSPVLSAESYPDECWTFCNTVALAAIRIADFLDGTDHSDFLAAWVSAAREQLVDPTTGLLVATYTPGGHRLEGPEGTSIWMAAHCLQLVDQEFAEDQYRRARRELGRIALGFGYAREWPRSWVGPMDVDSGPAVPLLGLSAAASSMALIGAGAFGDTDYLSALHASLQFAAFPSTEDGALKYCASNQVGDAALLYSTVLGPVWDVVRGGGRP